MAPTDLGVHSVVTNLSGAEEVGVGDLTASGLSTFEVDIDFGQLCFQLSFEDLDGINAAHIHEGASGTNGPVVVDLDWPTNQNSGCLLVSSTLLRDIVEHPDDYYVNVHTDAFPAGAVRGQLEQLAQGILGQVDDGTGPAGGAVVFVQALIEETISTTARTNPRGTYVIPGLGSHVQLVSWRPPSYTAAQKLSPDALGFVRRIDFALDATNTMTGTVIDGATSDGIEGIDICIDDVTPLLPDNASAADDDGEDGIACGLPPMADTNVEGVWSAELPPGLYRVLVGDPTGVYETHIPYPGIEVVNTDGFTNIGAVELFRCTPDRFTDVGADQPFCLPISWMAATGLSTGFPDDTFRPGIAVSRQAMAAFLWRQAGEPAPHSDVPVFSDVPASSPFFEAIQWMAESGLTTGFVDGTFRPTVPVSRQAFSAFLWRYAGEPPPEIDVPQFSDVPPSSPFYDAIQWMAESGLSSGFEDGTFRPVTALSRQAFAAFFYRGIRTEQVLPSF
ncbi:MAG: S-layer homology domain-containing protein [Acidimicrobiia bacterium]|nr:S-layer homology domain-containing protein [Acidimicrobiia bacterium]